MSNNDFPSSGAQEPMKVFHDEALEASARSLSASHHEHNINNASTLFKDFQDQDLSLEEEIRLARTTKNNMGQSKAAGGDMEAAVSKNEFDHSMHRQTLRPKKKRSSRASTMLENPVPQPLRREQESYVDSEYEDSREMDAGQALHYRLAPPRFTDSHRYAHAQRVQKTSVTASQRTTTNQIFSHEDLVSPSSTIFNSRLQQRSVAHHPRTRRRSSPEYEEETPLGATPACQAYFQPIGENLAPSRYSGATMPWGINKQPPAVTQDKVSDAALLKRGLKRGNGEKVIKRGYGANDPENIAIVNMKEQDKLSFDEITKVLNENRILQEKDPSLSVCGVNGRYNRTAPLLFAAQGKEFVPLKQRREASARSGELNDRPVFNDETDVILVQCVKDVEAQKWFQVAQLFTERTGHPMNPKSAAVRHGML